MIHMHVGFVYIFTITSHPYHFTERIILTGYLMYMQSHIRKIFFLKKFPKNYIPGMVNTFFLINEQVWYLVTFNSKTNLQCMQSLWPLNCDLKYLVLHFFKPNMYVTDYKLTGCLRFAHYKLFSFELLDIMSWYCNSWASYYFNIWYILLVLMKFWA